MIMSEHALKTLPEYFNAAVQGTKLFTIREMDRDFKLADTLSLQEWDGTKYTGRSFTALITYLLANFDGIENGFVVIGYMKIEREI